ncbi:MAG TPA: ribonuclease HI family protein [Ignavibacteria bacterium]|nr:ribonuclease HI family protein [Ignavibacteria bacterium]HQY51056.1 ribonuclease HI family protein [Ignavibacteria bacterium]HRB01570.1 ribonuclease HI family protein [Ignavibacteria bacterium]
MEKFVKVFTDGASRGNPGMSAIGIAVYNHEDELIVDHKKFIGTGTNNSAEYKALIESIKLLSSISHDFDSVNFYCDSELVVKQIKGQYKIKNPDMIFLSNEFFKELSSLQKKYTITHIPREKNKTADNLANQALDELKKNKTL